MGKVVSVKRIVGPKATGETCDIVINTGKDIPYWEGQSFGVIPPGINPKNGKPNSVRLYSIAASRYGDDMSGTQTTLCVRRATYWCPELKADDPAKKVCGGCLGPTPWCFALVPSLIMIDGGQQGAVLVTVLTRGTPPPPFGGRVCAPITSATPHRAPR